MASDTLRFTRTIETSPAEVYRAFTRSLALREWMCDGATLDARPGGRIYLYWHSGYYAVGEFTALEPGRCVAYTWHGKDEPGPMQIHVAFEPAGRGVEVTLAQSGFGEGPAWDGAREAATRGWEGGLENLQSVLETGQDLRYVRRPMVGIYLEEFNAEIAARLAVPVTEGRRLGGTVEGMSAARAGLQADDVIVSIAGHPTTDFPSTAVALQPYRAGDTVAVQFYRGPELRTVPMTLSGRPVPGIPAGPAALAETLRRAYRDSMADLEACLAGASDEEAARRPAPGEWNALETLAHLVIQEREHQTWIADLVSDDERWGDRDANTEILPVRLAGIVAANPGLAGMLQALKRSQAETFAMLAALPPEFVAHRGTYWRLSIGFLEGIRPPSHIQDHTAQIKAAIACCRQETEP